MLQNSAFTGTVPVDKLQNPQQIMTPITDLNHPILRISVIKVTLVRKILPKFATDKKPLNQQTSDNYG